MSWVAAFLVKYAIKLVVVSDIVINSHTQPKEIRKSMLYLLATGLFTVSKYSIIYLVATTSGQYKIHLVIMCYLYAPLHIALLAWL